MIGALCISLLLLRTVVNYVVAILKYKKKFIGREQIFSRGTNALKNG